MITWKREKLQKNLEKGPQNSSWSQIFIFLEEPKFVTVPLNYVFFLI